MSVSILIPAFRPTYLRQTIASALTQGTDDFELLISDDSGGDDVRPVVEAFRDPRIRYFTTSGRIGAANNCRRLWAEAARERLIFLLDDDLLMPHALVELAAQLDAHAHAAFAYGQRYTIDPAGRLTEKPAPAPKEVVVVNHPAMVSGLVGAVHNPIGEFTNVLINRAIGLTIEDMLSYRGLKMKVMGDVPFFLNATRKGAAIGIGTPVAAFRRHAAQSSSPDFNPLFAIGICEWELLIRGEYSDGGLTTADALRAVERLRKGYNLWSARLPLIATMVPSLEDLSERVKREDRDVFDAAFLADWSRFVTQVESADPSAP